MDLFENNNFKKEKVTFDCSIKNSKKNATYKIRISNEEKSLGEFSYIETEEKRAERNNEILNFKTLKGIEYRFYQIQLFTIIIMKKNPNNNFYDNYKRQTIMASLVTSEGSIYERKLNEDDLDSEYFTIEVKPEEKNIINSEIMGFFDSSLLNYFKNGGKIKLLFFFDFFGKDKDEDFVISSNIFYNLLVNFYNHCHLYTRGHEVFIFQANENPNSIWSATSTMRSSREDDFLYFDKFEDIKNYFIDCLNKELIENNLSISSFIKKSLNEYEDNFMNILIIFLRNLPEDINIVLDKIEETKSENKSMYIILINTGNKFSDYLSNKIENCSNMILIENKDDSHEILQKITHMSLNEIGKNLEKLTPNKKNQSILISNNYGMSINYSEENNEEKDEDNKQSFISNNMNNDSLNNSNIHNSSLNYNKEGKNFLKTSNTVISSFDNPYAHKPKNSINNNNQKSNLVKDSQNLYSSIPECINESDSEINKKEEEKDSLNKNLNKEDNKYDENKIIDSKAKTDYTSLNNKMKSKYILRDDD